MGFPGLTPLSGKRQEEQSRGACGAARFQRGTFSGRRLSPPQPWGLARASHGEQRAGAEARLAVRLCVGCGNPAWVSVPLSVHAETEAQASEVLAALNQEFFFFLSNY